MVFQYSFCALVRWFIFPKLAAILSLIVMPLDERSWSQPTLKIAEMKVHADSLNDSSCGILLLLWPSRFLCFRKQAMCYRKHTMFCISLLRNSFMPKREVAIKLLSHRLGSAGTLAPYGMTMGGEGSNEVDEWPLDAGLDVASLTTQEEYNGRKEKLN